MSLPLTKERLIAVYDCMQEFPPFCRMKLPPSSDVTFQVSRSKDRFAHYTRIPRTDRHFIVVSAVMHDHFDTLSQTVAHEMIHLYQAVAKTESSGTMHNAEFKRISVKVCKLFGWDVKVFVGTTG